MLHLLIEIQFQFKIYSNDLKYNKLSSHQSFYLPATANLAHRLSKSAGLFSCYTSCRQGTCPGPSFINNPTFLQVFKLQHPQVVPLNCTKSFEVRLVVNVNLPVSPKRSLLFITTTIITGIFMMNCLYRGTEGKSNLFKCSSLSPFRQFVAAARCFAKETTAPRYRNLEQLRWSTSLICFNGQEI